MKRAGFAGMLILAALLAGPARSETQPLPDLSWTDLEGRPFQLSEAWSRGPVIVNFWATWCRPCRKEIPELKKLVEAYGDSGLTVVAVNGDGPATQSKVRPYVKSQDLPFIVLLDPDHEIKRLLQVEVLPTTFVLNREGEPVHVGVGYRRGDEAVLREILRDLLGVEPGGD